MEEEHYLVEKEHVASTKYQPLLLRVRLTEVELSKLRMVNSFSLILKLSPSPHLPSSLFLYFYVCLLIASKFPTISFIVSRKPALPHPTRKPTIATETSELSSLPDPIVQITKPIGTIIGVNKTSKWYMFITNFL